MRGNPSRFEKEQKNESKVEQTISKLAIKLIDSILAEEQEKEGDLA